MKGIYPLVSCIALFFCSCEKNNDSSFKKKIIGEWTFVKAEILHKKETSNEEISTFSFNGKYKKGYIFYDNNVCEDKLGYFKKLKNRLSVFLGTETSYQLIKDSLKIFDLSGNVWLGYKIFQLNSDTLTLLKKDSTLMKFVKCKYILDSKENYDKIIVSSSGCYGTCPISDISIDKQGLVLFNGWSSTTSLGMYTSEISPKEYLKLERNFKKAAIDELAANYVASWTDDEAITITFIKDNKIYKTISDYGRQSPTEFYWAYMPVRYVYQQLKLIPLLTNDNIPPFREVNFKIAQEICHLSESESFYLRNEISEGKEVQRKIEPKYVIEYMNDDDEIKLIKTDGRFYMFDKDYGNRVLDIGYNFVERNGLGIRFIKRTEYD